MIAEEAAKKLSNYQLEIVEECLEKKSAGLSVPMGGGKTRISIYLCDIITEEEEPILIIVESKNLIQQWINEIRELYGDYYKYYVYHGDYDKNRKEKVLSDEKFIITTPQMISALYNENPQLERWLITKEIRNEGQFGQHEVNNYSKGPMPINSNDIIYSRMWKALIVDEFHLISNIDSTKCKALLCIPAERKWLLSGTLIANPVPSKIISYFTMLELENVPTNLPDLKLYLKGEQIINEVRYPKFLGMNGTMVHRSEIPIQVEKEVHKVVVELTREEREIYLIMRTIAIQLSNELKEATANKSSLSAALLAMLTYLRECVVCPMIPIASMALNVCTYSYKDELANRFFEIFNRTNLMGYLNNTQNVLSSKILKAYELIRAHNKVIVFCSYRTIIDIMINNLDEDIPAYTIDGSMSGKKRAEMLEEVKNLDRFCIFLTYKIGSSGLNLQFANTVIAMDIEWMESNMSQAIARVVRQGQQEKVNVYFILSNTGVENAIYNKQINKRNIIAELKTGPAKTAIDRIKVVDIVKLLEQETIERKMEMLYIK